jgi:hypothetical protein
MPTTDQHPEEAATKVPAAAASFAGSLAQTRMYAWRGRQDPDAKRNGTQTSEQAADDQAEPPTEDTPTQQPAGEDAAAAEQLAAEQLAAEQLAAEQLAAELTERAVGGLQRELAELDAANRPAAADAGRAAAPAESSDVPPAAGGDEPAVSDEVVLACGELDAAAAAGRLAQGQLVEPPALAPPAPGIAPGL